MTKGQHSWLEKEEVSVLHWLGLVAILLAWIGYQWLLRLIGVDFYASWIVALLAQIMVLYVFAMIGQLRLGIYLVVGLGVLISLVLFPLALFRKIDLLSEDIHLFDLWMVVFGIALAVALFLSPLIHYDNFSHWALIVKFMTYTGHLPRAADQIISFTSYPPATALWLTEWATLVGYHDGVLLVAQFGLIWSATYALFAVLRDRTRALTAMVLCFAISIANVFNIAIRFNNLLVDYVLPIVTAAGLAVLYAHRDQPRYQWPLLALFSASLLLIKNSGTFFVVVLVGYGLYLNLKRLRHQGFGHHLRGLLGYLVTVVLGVLPFLWWQQHVKITFPSSSKHQIDFQAYLRQLKGESDGTMMKITTKFFRALFDPSTLALQGMLLVSAALLVAWIVIRWVIKRRNPLLKLLIVVDLGYLLYAVSVLAMYLVSMPYAEAIKLDGLERYLASTVILSLFVAALALAVEFDYALYEQNFAKRGLRSFRSVSTKTIYQTVSFGLLTFSVIMMVSEINGIDHINAVNQRTLPVQLTKISQPRTKVTDQKFLLVYPEPEDVDNYYAGQVGRYYYFTDKLVGQEAFQMTPAAFKTMIQQYDYVAIPEHHLTFSKLLRKTYGQTVRTGLFRVTPTGLQRIDPQARHY
ncbi:ABC transporter permease [Lapidilactobacillus salsurivasis]